MGNGSEKKKENRKEEKLMKKFLLALFFASTSASATYAASDSVRFMYSVVDNKNQTHSDRYAVKWDHDLVNNVVVDGRASISQNRDTDLLVAAFEIGAAKRFPIDKNNTVYIRPEIGTVTPSGSSNNYYAGVEVGYITKLFPDQKFKLKVDHAWIEGINNERTDGTLSRAQLTYDVTNSISAGPRVEFRRGNTESDAFTFIVATKF